jgi:hypothetical protein
LKNDCENTKTLAHNGETLGVLDKGGEKGEEKEAKLGLRCCHGCTATPVVVIGWEGESSELP